MARLPVFILILLLPLAPASGEDGGEPPRFFEMSRATVLASPDTPAALHPFLPGGKAPRPLTWPLPEGPLLVLGLPDTDEIAREIADAFSLAVDEDALGGGYRIDAWRAGERNLVFVFGSDPAALYAARFEFDATAPAEMMDPDARSLDFKRPNQQAGLVVRAGRRVVKPSYALRALDPGANVSESTEALTVGARGNRVLLDVVALGPERARASAERLRHFGVAPIYAVRIGLVPGHPPKAAADRAIGAVMDVMKAIKGVYRLDTALIFDTALDDVKQIGRTYGKLEAAAAKEFAWRLDGLDWRRWRLQTTLRSVLVVPRCHSDRLARLYGPPPDMSKVPEAVIAWSGPLEHSLTITRAQAERRVREAGVPVVLYETWAAPFQGNEAYLPVRPYGRAEDLPDVLDGIVVVGTRGTGPILESAWAPVEEDPFGAQLLAPLLPKGSDDAQAFLTKAAMRIEKEVDETLGLVPWMAPLAAHARATALRIHKGARAVAVPVVPAEVVLDGRIDEAAWGYARRIPLDRSDAEVLALSDGRSLRFAARLEKGAPPLGFALTVPRGGSMFSLGLGGAGVVCVDRGRKDRTPHGKAVRNESASHHTAEFSLDRFALGGEAHALRVFEFAAGEMPSLLVVTR